MWYNASINCVVTPFNFSNVYLIIAELVISKKINLKLAGSQLIGSNAKQRSYTGTF